MAFWDGVGGGLASGGIQAIGGFLANQQTAASQNRAQDFMAEMSNTAHQREVADLRAAGLNPILSVNKGASTPSSSGQKMENALGAGVTTALDTLRLKKDVEGMGSQIALNNQMGEKAKADTLTSLSTAKQNEVKTRILETEFPAIQSEAKTRKNQAEWDQRMMKYDNIQKRIQGGLDTVGSATRIIKPGGFTGGETREKWKNRDEQKEDQRQQQFRDAEAIFNKRN